MLLHYLSSTGATEDLVMYVLNTQSVDLDVLVIDPEEADNSIASPALSWAAWNNQWASMRLLLEAGCGVDVQNSDGSTALILACIKGLPQSVAVLLNYEADMEKVTRSNNTALEWACVWTPYRFAFVTKHMSKVGWYATFCL